MNTIKTYTIKGMVCNRCITELAERLKQHDLIIHDLKLGSVGLSFQSEKFNDESLQLVLKSLGFSLVMKKNEKIVEQVKASVQAYFMHLDPLEIRTRFSETLAESMHMTYDTISSIFAADQRITIEQYMMQYRIEKVKQLLTETSLSLTEIAFRTGYSSIHHLSKQFKTMVGHSPSVYRDRIRAVAVPTFSNYARISGQQINLHLN